MSITVTPSAGAQPPSYLAPVDGTTTDPGATTDTNLGSAAATMCPDEQVPGLQSNLQGASDPTGAQGPQGAHHHHHHHHADAAAAPQPSPTDVINQAPTPPDIDPDPAQ